MALVQWKGPVGQLVEAPDSPTYDLNSGAALCTRVYFGMFAIAKAALLPIGAAGTGDMTGWGVNKCSLQRQRGAVGKLTVIYGAGGGGGGSGGSGGGAASGIALPPDQMNIAAFELLPALEKNRRYRPGGAHPLDQDALKRIRLAIDQNLNPSQVSDPDKKIQLQPNDIEFYNKQMRGQTNFILSGYNYSWTQCMWTASGVINQRTYLESPGGPLASFLPSGVVSLRKADNLEWTGQMFRYTRTWSIFDTTEAEVYADPDIYTL